MSNNNIVPKSENPTKDHMTVVDPKSELIHQHKAETNLLTQSRNSLQIQSQN